jgi:hypothetical protein
MFEMFGYYTARLYGFGWLWGRQDFQELLGEAAQQGQSPSMYVFGNGSSLLWIGLLSIAAHVALVVWLLVEVWNG